MKNSTDFNKKNFSATLQFQFSPKNQKALESYGSYSKQKVWWVCDEGHEWEATISNRTKGSGCPFCSNKKVLAGFNDLASQRPDISQQWHPTKNGKLSPVLVSVGSSKKVWWIDEYNHEWEMFISARTGSRRLSCPYCSNQKILTGFNDLKTTNPDILKEWNYEKNINIAPNKITISSTKKVWWICDKEHEWEASLNSRRFSTAIPTKCPYCSGRKVIKGQNDLATLSPSVANEWHPTKNSPLSPHHITNKGSKKVWWICDKSHEWAVSPGNRSRGEKCPICAATIFSSKAEKDIQNYLSSLGIDFIINSRKILDKNLELDIYVPEKKIVIEFNGLYWHSERSGKSKKYHYNKWFECKEKNIQLIQIWEDDWIRNPYLIKNMLAYKMGKFQTGKIYGRDTFVKSMAVTDAKQFLAENHIQGFASGSYYLGLKDSTDKNVALMVLRKEQNNVLNITRFATSKSVVGGFSKLLKYAEINYQPDSFITFSDHTISDGGLYEKNGFLADKELPPDYMYVVRGERKHKFGYRLEKFKNDPSLKYEDGLTEQKLAMLNNLYRIWDAGKTRWIKKMVSTDKS